ncbi:hypothetical protein TSUD_145630 [Trifolium subterraneum]|uniref:Uncharacterized protein n=1 Tax=Trifolium subterraneum TaxID=3900 RepID=A0A2Z6NLZ6_TRISU|nr:hypothetical protein TSUD_145630 [Trifolium subterraneum]
MPLHVSNQPQASKTAPPTVRGAEQTKPPRNREATMGTPEPNWTKVVWRVSSAHRTTGG